MAVTVVAYDTAHPGDTSDLAGKLASLPAAHIRRLALLVKTEGNSDVNDYSREYALMAAEQALRRHGGDALVERSTFLISTGCEGAMTPFGYLFADCDDTALPVPRGGRALAIGCARSRSLTPTEIGTCAQAFMTADVVRVAIADAGVTASDVELVIVKTPIMTLIPATAATFENKRITSACSKAIASLGAGLALNEVEEGMIRSDVFDVDHSVYARRVMSFSGSEVDFVEVMVLANRKGQRGNLVVKTGFLADLLDAPGLRGTLHASDISVDAEGRVVDPDRVVAVLAKIGTAPDGRLRGHRTTMKTSHIDMDKHARATFSGVVGSVLGSCRVFISANTVHQAPPGGGLCAIIVKTA